MAFFWDKGRGAGPVLVRLGSVLVGLAGAGVLVAPRVVSADAVGAPPLEIVQTVVAHENEAEKVRGHYSYLSQERSERTGGHLWTERVAETTAGKVKMLIAEDGQPLNGARLGAENARLADIAAHPDDFAKKAQALKNDEQHAKEMLTLLPKAFVFENARQEGGFLRIDFKPNPQYEPQSMEERVLHGMSGSLLVEQPAMRLHEIQARLPEDMSLGFGLLATIHAGSNFSTTRERVWGNEWKTAVLDTDINGKAIFFKAIAKKEHAEHRDFQVLPMDMTVAQAVEMLEKR
jgi:hypothetical protein